MKRNVEKTIARGAKLASENPRRDLKCMEATEMRVKFAENAEKYGVNEAIWEAITDAYKFGVAVGYGIGADKMKKLDCVTYYHVCKEMNVPLDHFLEEGATV